jgi:hypothetical protein
MRQLLKVLFGASLCLLYTRPVPSSTFYALAVCENGPGHEGDTESSLLGYATDRCVEPYSAPDSHGYSSAFAFVDSSSLAVEAFALDTRTEASGNLHGPVAKAEADSTVFIITGSNVPAIATLTVPVTLEWNVETSRLGAGGGANAVVSIRHAGQGSPLVCEFSVQTSGADSMPCELVYELTLGDALIIQSTLTALAEAVGDNGHLGEATSAEVDLSHSLHIGPLRFTDAQGNLIPDVTARIEGTDDFFPVQQSPVQQSAVPEPEPISLCLSGLAFATLVWIRQSRSNRKACLIYRLP